MILNDNDLDNDLEVPREPGEDPRGRLGSLREDAAAHLAIKNDIVIHFKSHFKWKNAKFLV